MFLYNYVIKTNAQKCQKTRLFGGGEEVKLGSTLCIHCFPRGNVCIKVGRRYPPSHMGSAKEHAGKEVLSVGAVTAVWVHVCCTRSLHLQGQ